MDVKDLLKGMGIRRSRAPKGLPKRYGKRSKAGYYTRAFARTAAKKARNVARQQRRAARNRQSA